jgi:REP element-mobilizing transposase RayT
VTTVTRARLPLFDDWYIGRIAARAITDPRLWTSATLLAWVLMPDHWHGLVELGDGHGLPETMRRLKANVAREVRLARPAVSGVWARGYHDRALRVEDSMADVARYIVRNPVRAGLVRRVGCYPFWDAAWV